MVGNDDSPAPAPLLHILRLVVFAAAVLGLFYLVAFMRIIDLEEVRSAVAATGPAAPLAYVVVSAVLGALFVPGPLLAAGSGVLFGPVLGTFVTLGATIGTATVTALVGRWTGRGRLPWVIGHVANPVSDADSSPRRRHDAHARRRPVR